MRKTQIGHLVIYVIFLFAASSCSWKLTPYKSMSSSSKKELEKQYYFTEALKFYELNDLNMSRALFLQVIKTDPSCDACYYKLAEMHLLSGYPKEALEYIQSAVNMDSTNLWYHILMGKSYMANLNFDKAIEIFEDINKKSSQHPELYYHLAILYAGKQQPQKALQQLDTFARMTGEDEAVLLMRYELLQNMGNQDAALETLKTLGENTSDVRVYVMLGEAYSTIGQDTLGLAYFEKALSIAPSYPPALFGEADFYRRSQYFDVFFQKLYSLYALKEVPMPLKIEYTTALLKAPQFTSIFKKQLDTLFSIIRTPVNRKVEPLYGSFLIQSGQGDSALTIFKDAAYMFKTDTLLWETYLGFLYYRQSWDTLEVHASEAIKIFPSQVNFMTMKAIALWQQDKISEAIHLLEKTIPLSKDEPETTVQTYSFLGDLYHLENNSKKAFGYYEKVLAIDSANTGVLNNYAYYLSLTDKQLDKAYRMSEKTIAAEPNNATYLDTFGWILYKMGKFIEAKAIFRHAMIYGGMDSAVILDHYGDVLNALGEKETATVYWERSYKKEPNPEVKQKLQP
jgi:tetratricopeptide (TPR) repeat protein